MTVPLARRHSPQQRFPTPLGFLQVQRVIRKGRPVYLERGEHGLGRLAVEPAWSRLPPAFLPIVVSQAYPDGAVIALAAAGDDERVPGLEMQQLDIHPQWMRQRVLEM